MGKKIRKRDMTTSKVAEAANEAAKNEIDSLKAEVKRLTDLVSDMAKARSDQATRTIHGVVDRAKDKASDTADAVIASGRQAADEVSRRVEPLATELAASVERNPLSAVAIAAGIGLLVGLLTRQGS
jgi:ElaB/YqjD/DUF883 family membrane-anchored ribosome-binding protein